VRVRARERFWNEEAALSPYIYVGAPVLVERAEEARRCQAEATVRPGLFLPEGEENVKTFTFVHIFLIPPFALSRDRSTKKSTFFIHPLFEKIDI
jgi:hypothetical protein